METFGCILEDDPDVRRGNVCEYRIREGVVELLSKFVKAEVISRSEPWLLSLVHFRTQLKLDAKLNGLCVRLHAAVVLRVKIRNQESGCTQATRTDLEELLLLTKAEEQREDSRIPRRYRVVH